MILGKAVSEKSGYSIHQLFVMDSDGVYIFAGYGVFNPAGELMKSCPTLEVAEDYFNEVASPPPSSRSRKM